MKASIIIPVYNVENYLRKCVDSVIQQSYKDFEIILVDDGSTDNSGRICDEFEVLDNRIKVIHKPNGGLMSAWKTGFLYSNGEYVGFVDSDDWIDKNMLEKFLENALLYDADIVVCQLIKENQEKGSFSEKEKLWLKPGIYNSERINKEILTGIINDGRYLGRKLSPNRVTKFFKRNLIQKNLQFFDESISFGEDLVTCFSCVCDAEKIVIMSDFYPYHYRINNQSITGKYDEKRIEKANLLNSKLKEISKYKKLNILNQIANDYISLALLCIESEILYAPFSRDIILNRIKRISESDIFVTSINEGNTKNFLFKYKFYLFLIKHKKYSVLFMSRRIFNTMKSFRDYLNQV